MVMIWQPPEQQRRRKAGENMTEKQRYIYDYISNQFVLEAVHCDMIGEDKVKITDCTGDSLTFTLNDKGEIVDVNENKVVAYRIIGKWVSIPAYRTLTNAVEGN